MTDIMKVGDTLNAKETMSSVEIAELTGKRHSDVLEAIRNMEEAWERVAQRKFPLGSYKDANQQDRPCYELSKIECLYVATKFNDEARAKLIIRWEQLELMNKPKLPQTFSEALQLAANQAKELEEKNALLIEQAPKVEFFDAVADSKDAIGIGELSKILGIKGMGRNNLFEFLRNEKVLMNDNVPYQRYQDMGLFRVIEQKYMKNGEPCMNIKTLVYQKGVDYIRKLINNK